MLAKYCCYEALATVGAGYATAAAAAADDDDDNDDDHYHK